MNHPVATALYNQSAEEYEALHAADLDVWVAYDGGTVIVRQGSGGHKDDADGVPGNPGIPVGVSPPTETENTGPAVTTGTVIIDVSPTGGPTMSTAPATTQSPYETSTITPSADLPTLMSESQAPSSSSLLGSSESEPLTVSNTISSSSSGTPSMSQSLLSTSPSTSIVSSAEPSPTVTAPPIPNSSDYLLHTPPYYVAIILGSIVGVAVLAALIAWAFRRQVHERHRRLVDSAAKLPWVYSADGNDHDRPGDPSTASDIENAMRTTNTEMGIMNLGSREDMAYLQSWEPRGDRDTGEPKRSEVHIDRKPRPTFLTQQIPSYALFSRYSGQQFIRNSAMSPYDNRVSQGSIDSHLQVDTLGKGTTLLITNQVPGDISASSSQEVGFRCPSRDSVLNLPEIGTPRELVPMPRFLGLDGRGLSTPWEEKALWSVDGEHGTKTRSRIMSAEHIRKTWERQTLKGLSESTHDRDDLIPDDEGWTNTIKSNLVGAFNAVAASLPITAIKEGKEGSNSKFTPALPKRSSKRQAPRHSSPTRGEANLNLILSRGCTIKSSASDPWSLVETGSNTGVVHIRLPTSDLCSVSSHNLSDSGFGLSRSYTLHSVEPLQIRKKLSTSFLKNRASISSGDSRVRAPFSRSSSVGCSVSPKRHRKSPGGSIKRKITLDRRSSPLFSRSSSVVTSSSATSAVSIVTGSEDMRERRLLAREALKDRRKKAKRLQETPVA